MSEILKPLAEQVYADELAALTVDCIKALD